LNRNFSHWHLCDMRVVFLFSVRLNKLCLIRVYMGHVSWSFVVCENVVALINVCIVKRIAVFCELVLGIHTLSHLLVLLLVLKVYFALLNNKNIIRYVFILYKLILLVNYLGILLDFLHISFLHFLFPQIFNQCVLIVNKVFVVSELIFFALLNKTVLFFYNLWELNRIHCLFTVFWF